MEKDHRATTLQLQFPTAATATTVRRRVVKYDRTRAAHPTVAEFRAIHHLLWKGPPTLVAQVDASSRLAVLDRWLLALLQRFFPHSPSPPKPSYLQPQTLELLYEAKVLADRNATCARRISALRFAFMVWAHRPEAWDRLRGPVVKVVCIEAAQQWATLNTVKATAWKQVKRDTADRANALRQEVQSAYNSGSPVRMFAVTRKVIT